MFKINRAEQGYVAITSVIILSSLLMLVAISAGVYGYFARLNILETEYKQRSLGLAESCAQMALLRLKQFPDYLGEDRVYLTKTENCRMNVSVFGANRLIQAQGKYIDAFTNLSVEVNSFLDLVSWLED